MSTFRLGHAVPHTLTRPLVIAIALMLATPTFAADFTITGAETNPQVLNGASTGVIEAGGTLTVNIVEDAIVLSNPDNTITNNGAISAGNMGIYSSPTATNATITNIGTITSGNDGILSSGTKAIITNSGTINTGDDGIYSSGTGAIITNSGNITGADDGIFSRGNNLTINNTNSGTINGTYGIGSTGTGTIINNSGHITGTNHAVYGGITDGLTLNLLKGSQLMGAIDLGGAGDNDTVNIHGGSVSATLTLLKVESVNLLGPGLKLGEYNGVVVSVDGTAEAARSVVLSTITSDIHDQIAQRTYLPAAPQPVKGVTSTVLPGLQFKQHKPVAWMQVLGGDSDRDAEDNARSYEHDYVGINGGYEWDLGQRRVGLVGGVVNSDTDGNENSFKSDTEHFYLGAYTSQQLQGFTLTTSLLGGYGRHDNERLVIDNLNGREVAK